MSAEVDWATAIGGWLSTGTQGVKLVDTALGSVKALKEILKKPKTLSPAEIGPANAELANLTEQLLTLKQAQLELLDLLMAVKQQKMDLDTAAHRRATFEAQAADYVIQEISPHSHAYVLKPEIRQTQPMHYLCVQCFEQKERSLLQFQKRNFHFDTLSCPRCGATARVPNNYAPTVRVGRISRSRGWEDL